MEYFMDISKVQEKFYKSFQSFDHFRYYDVDYRLYGIQHQAPLKKILLWEF